MIALAAGERVTVRESGPADGPPVLVLSGLGGAWFDWGDVVAALPAHRVTVFDRPGAGTSPAARRPPSLRRDAAILAALARRAGRPVTVVAHSMGAFAAEAFARLHPDLVAGVVLVDGSHEFGDVHAHRLSAGIAPLARAAGTALAATGVPWLLAPAARNLLLRLTARRVVAVPPAPVRAVYGRGVVLGTIVTEWSAYREMAADLAALRERRPFPPVPLVVLTAPWGPRWEEGHRRIAAFSPRGRHVALSGTRHMIMFDRPDAVADAVREVAR
ncbi:alpha/beta fold hydrolase [Actinomadura flavalba]|uniref:alpha/beta fold hydrolase n=1 Tax=Actinomadura flavalba TaxID=1120938 RepID=UPI0003781766|nr:alpha/beta hydrolase [Actinomadura flavalba]